MNAEFITCAFCGTDMKQGFKICPGCGATYQRPAEIRFRALCFAVFGIGIFLLALSENRMDILIGASVLAVVFVFISIIEYRKSGQGAWRRARSDR